MTRPEPERSEGSVRAGAYGMDDLRRLLPRGLGIAHPVFAERALGAELWDADGRRYLDFVAGIGTLNTGHAHPRVVEAARAQLDRFTHTAFQAVPYEPYLRLAERLIPRVPVRAPAKAAFFTSGAEAVENACKIARAATGRPALVSFSAGFHGRTNLGLALTAKVRPYKQNFGPFTPEVHHAVYPDAFRGVDTDAALARLHDLFDATVAPERVAAVVIEPVAGEGGFLPAPAAFMRALRELCDRHGIVLIVDEIQTGFGRTGAWFATEHAGIEADLICVAKSLAGGFPLSGVIGAAEIVDAPEPGGLGGTDGGNPVACAAANAVLDVIVDEDLIRRADVIGARLKGAAEGWRARWPTIQDVRGPGAMVAMEFVDDADPRKPRPDLVRRTVEEARERGLLLFTAGMYGNVVRFLPPLVASDAQVDEAAAIVEASLEAAHATA